MKNSVSSDYSVPGIWLSEYTLPTKKLTNVRLSPLGVSLAADFDRWTQACGDEYVDEITLGAKLFFSIRVDFSSKEQKQSFESRFSLSGPLYSAQADLNTASREFSRDSKVTVAAFQIGGDVSKLTDVLGNSQAARDGFVQCSLGNFTDCAKVIAAALEYGSDTNSGFPSQLSATAAGGSPLLYKTASYSSAGIFIRNYPGLEETIRQARNRLHAEFEKQFAMSIMADRLLELGLGLQRQGEIATQRAIVDANLSNIIEASKTCYDQIEGCKAAVDGLLISAVDQQVFALPELPTVSYRLVTQRKGILTRSESVERMNVEVECSEEGFLGVGGCETRPIRLDEVVDNGDEASTVMLIEGVGLKEAQLFSENKPIEAILLVRQASSYPDKFGPGWAFIVIDSTRLNPDWRDINIPEKIIDLAKGVLDANGTFYVEIVDEFGRRQRVDISYVAWRGYRISDREQWVQILETNNWWDPQSNGGDPLKQSASSSQESYGVTIQPAQ